MKIKLTALLVGLVSISGWAGEFPLCMYGVNNPADLKLLKKSGFTCVQSYRRNPEKIAPLARRARELKMKVVFYPNKVIGSSYEKEALLWPVLAWYLVDEPDVAKWSRARVIKARDAARAAFPQDENALVISQGKTKVPFYDLPDNLMMDWYPVPHLALTSFGDNVRKAKEGQTEMNAGERPLWGVVQIFNWKEYKQYRPDNDRIGRFPTAEEIRFMSYDGIVNGASGLFYFIFTTEGKPLPTEKPEWWARVTNTTRELNKLLPVLEKGVLMNNPVEISAPMAMQTRQYKGHLYSILINRSGETVRAPEELLQKGKTYEALMEKAVRGVDTQKITRNVFSFNPPGAVRPGGFLG